MSHPFKSLSVSLGAVALSFAASMAHADTVNLTSHGAQWTPFVQENVDTNPAAPGWTWTGYSQNVSWEKANVGAFNMEVTAKNGAANLPSTSLIAWCVEVSSSLATSAQYQIATTTASWMASLTRLFNKYYDAVTDNVTSAAMQLAIWEIVGGDGGSKYGLNLKDGAFQAKPTSTKAGSDTQKAFNQAQQWLADLNKGQVQDKYTLVHLTNGGSQDLVTIAVNEVPLPGAALMFLSALGVGGLARRKRAAAQTAGALAA